MRDRRRCRRASDLNEMDVHQESLAPGAILFYVLGPKLELPHVMVAIRRARQRMKVRRYAVSADDFVRLLKGAEGRYVAPGTPSRNKSTPVLTINYQLVDNSVLITGTPA